MLTSRIDPVNYDFFEKMLSLLDLLFTIFHVALIVFNLTGWIWKKTRRLHLITLLLTAASWAILGIWYGLGYCPLTDWHWQVKEKLGETHLPNSFVKYLLDKLLGTDLPVPLVDQITLYSLLAAVVAAAVVNLMPLLVRKRNQ